MSELLDIVVPTEQREGTQSKIGRWLKKVGDAVRKDEPILEINTDKVTLEVAAPGTGRLVSVARGEGDEISLAESLGKIELGEAEGASINEMVLKADNISPVIGELSSDLSPAVRALARQHGVDPSTIRGSGRAGRVTAKDIEEAVRATTYSISESSASIRRPHSSMRKRIAAHMVESVAKAPHVTSVFEIDFGAVLRDKEARSVEAASRGIKLTLTAYLVRAVARALRSVPTVNSRWHDEYLEVLQDIHIGVAIAVESSQEGDVGLVVPVIRNADSLELLEIASKLADLTARARDGKLTQQDLSGATFSISNHGMGGSLFAAPIIIPQPQVAILGVGKVEKRTFVEERDGSDSVSIRPAAYVTLSIDHRALDGFVANRFLSKFAASLI